MNPYAPAEIIGQLETPRKGRPAWVIPTLIAMGILTLFLACNSFFTSLDEPFFDDMKERVYSIALFTMSASAFWLLLMLYSLVKRWIPIACILLLMIPLLCLPRMAANLGIRMGSTISR